MSDPKTEKNEFSFRTRAHNLKRLESEEFDFLIIGGGITGAGVAWDASSRGYKVALIEKDDFAQGTSSRSSKLIHGGLRYLENYEFPLVFESLSERAYLMRACPHLVKPIPFYMPVYENSPHSSHLISAGLWLYDTLSLFRAPGLHQRISAGASIRTIPGIKKENLVCTFKYFDASMWDDALVIDVLRAAKELGACIVSQMKATAPSYDESGMLTQLTAHDQLSQKNVPKNIQIKFKKLIVCAGVWTDQVGRTLDQKTWKNWLAPSRGVHLIFDWKRFPVPGAVTMQIGDGRIAFAIPRHDFGQGVTMVGTTDGPCTLPPDQVENEESAIAQDQKYLLSLLEEYFPELKLTEDDVLSHTIGIRPLVNPNREQAENNAEENKTGNKTEPQKKGSKNLQAVSREQTIEHGPGGSVFIAGGKYTTFRKIAEEVVDFAARDLKEETTEDTEDREPQTDGMIFPPVLPSEVQRAREIARAKAWKIPEKLYDRYGSDALVIYQIHEDSCDQKAVDPEGFPLLEAQFRYAVRYQMVLKVEDFVRRRQPLYLCRQDHGAPWYSLLQKALDEELSR